MTAAGAKLLVQKGADESAAGEEDDYTRRTYRKFEVGDDYWHDRIGDPHDRNDDERSGTEPKNDLSHRSKNRLAKVERAAEDGVVRARMIHDFRDCIFLVRAPKDLCCRADRAGKKPVHSPMMIHLHSSHSPITTQLPTQSEKVARTPAPADAAELKIIQQLSSRDREVRTHEQAHVAASGGLANGGPSFQFTRGPDGRLYATGGEVGIDVSPVANDPQATIEKAQKIRRAALAPANPSQADRNVAARATAMATEARVQLQRERHDSDTENQVGDKAVTGTAPAASDRDLVALFSTDAAERSAHIDQSV